MRKDQAAQQRLFSGTILRGLTQPLNTYGYKYFSQAKSAAADGLTYSDTIDRKCGKFKSEHFLPPRKKLTDSNTFRTVANMFFNYLPKS
jgi:hypothetical protein